MQYTFKPKRVFLTGGSGFLGGHIATELVSRGHEVVMGDISEENLPEIYADVSMEARDRLHFEFVNVTNLPSLQYAIVKHNPDHIVHLAGISNTVDSATGQLEAMKVGLLGLGGIFDSLVKLKECKDIQEMPHVSIASSSLVSGTVEPGNDGEVDNSEPWLNLKNCYHQYCDVKLMMEMLCRDNAYQFGIPTTAIRLGTQYGPRMNRNVVTWYFIRNALLGKPIQIQGDGLQWRQHYYCTDFAKAVRTVVENQEQFVNDIVSPVPDEMTTVKDIAVAVQRAIPGSAIEFVPARSIDVKVRQIRPSEKLRHFGWKQEVSLSDGVERTVAYYKKRMDLVTQQLG